MKSCKLSLQIYNEMIRDLLNPSSGILELREDAKGGTQVAGLSKIKARSTDEVILYSKLLTCLSHFLNGQFHFRFLSSKPSR